MDHEIPSAAVSAAKDLTAVKAKISADLNSLKADMGCAKNTRDIKVAETRADWTGRRASQSLRRRLNEQAKFAVLDAIEARQAADMRKPGLGKPRRRLTKAAISRSANDFSVPA